MKAQIGVLLYAISISISHFVFFDSNNVTLCANIDASLIQLLDVGILIIKNSNFNDNNQTFLSISTSNVIIVNSSIENNVCTDLVFACFAFISRGKLKIINSNITNIISLKNKQIISASLSQIIFRENLFLNLEALQSPIAFYLEDAFLFIQRNNISNYSGGLIHVSQSSLKSLVIICESKFKNEHGTKDQLARSDAIHSTIRSDNSTTMIINSTFEGNINQITEGGVLKFEAF